MRDPHSKVRQSISGNIVTIVLSIIATLSALITIYAFFFQKGKVEITCQVLGEMNALDINQEVPNLKILLGNEDILASKRNLRIIDVRLVNTGTVDILKTFYDGSAPFGLSIQPAEIIQTPSVIDASNSYLKSNLAIRPQGKNSLLIDPIIIEKGESFTLRLIVLHSQGLVPTIKPIGKIAGLLTIPVIYREPLKTPAPFFQTVFSGNVLVQLVRALLYFIALLIITTIVALIATGVSDRLQKTRRSRQVREFKNLPSVNYRKTDEVVFKRYIDEGHGYLRSAHGLLSDETKLNEIYQSESAKPASTSQGSHPENQIEFVSQGSHSQGRNRFIIHGMLVDGVVTKQGQTITINGTLKETIDKLHDFISKKDKNVGAVVIDAAKKEA